MIRIDRKLNSTDVLDALTDLFILRGPPEYIRSENGLEFIALKVRDWIAAVGAKTAYIEPGSPNGGRPYPFPSKESDYPEQIQYKCQVQRTHHSYKFLQKIQGDLHDTRILLQLVPMLDPN